ncbi:MAG: amidohydrolase [Candidatus Caldatribacteriota bacterium]|nr:amidohydrolase [Atribacterota bacterium]
MELKPIVNLLINEAVSLRRDFHRFPEIGWNEVRTSKKIYQYLEEINLEVKKIASTGVIGLLRGKKKGPTLLIRSDIDALPVQEMNEVSYKSTIPGVMHACGHDGHMAMLLIAAKILSKYYKNRINGNIKFVFQPDEESAEGAKRIIKEGVLSNPKVNAAMGIHLWSQLEKGTVGIKDGAIMASLATFRIKVVGKGGHTGYPDHAIDPVMAAANIIQQIQIIQTREINQLNPLIIMIGKISGGKKNNIIPDFVELEGTIRYLERDKYQKSIKPIERFKELIYSISQVNRVQIEIEITEKNKMVVNDKQLTEIIKSAAIKVVDRDKIIDFTCSASEDFSEFSHTVPSVFYFLGCGNSNIEKRVSHHNCFFNIDEDMLPIGIEMHVQSALEFFKKYKIT